MTTDSTTQQPPTRTEPTHNPRAVRLFWIAFTAILIGEVLDLLDSLVTTVAGPSILRDLGGSDALLQWLSAGYTLAMAGGVLIGGRLGDRYGRRRLFLIGMAGFTLASILAAAAPTAALLLAARIAQGLLGALMLPQSMGLIRDIAGPERMRAAFGVFGVTLTASAIAGPIVAGLLVDADILGLGWRAIFAINIPLGLAGLVLGRRFLPASRPDRTLRIDVLGSVIALAMMVAVVLPLVEGREAGWPWWAFALLGLGAALLGVFVVQQRTRAAAGRDPLVLPSLFGKRDFVAGIAISLAFFTAFMSSAFVLAVLFQIGLGLSPLVAAGWMLSQAVGMIIGFKGVGKLLSGRRQLLVGFAIAGIGQALLVGVLLWQGDALQPWWLTPALLVTGAGSGAAMGPIFEVIMARLDEAETGSASGILNAIQQVGGATGVAAIGTVLFAVAAQYADPLHGLIRGATWAYGLSVVLVALALVLAAKLLPKTE